MCRSFWRRSACSLTATMHGPGLWRGPLNGTAWLFLCAGLAGVLLAGGQVFSHAGMVTTFGLAGLFVLAVWCVGFYRFWKESGAAVPDVGASGQALADIFALTNLR